LRIKIAGIGRYIPSRVVTNEELEATRGIKPGYLESKLGIKSRRKADKETASFMAAEAAKEAIKDANLTLDDIDLILNASGTPEQPIPDNGPFVQHWLGLDKKGTPAFSIHATCLSFIVALHVSSSFISTGLYKRILIVSSEIMNEWGLNWNQPHPAGLFGDAAGAAVVTATPEGEASCVTKFSLSTHGDQTHCAGIRGGGNKLHPLDPACKKEDLLFNMHGHELLQWAMDMLPGFLENFKPGLTERCDYAAAIVHQASGNGLGFVENGLGWGNKVVRTFDWTGNTVAASIPVTLYEAVKSGKLKRGEEAIMLGTGAGLSMAALSFIY